MRELDYHTQHIVAGQPPYVADCKVCMDSQDGYLYRVSWFEERKQ